MMREKIRLNSTAGTGHFYTTTKNKRTMSEKLEIMKFDPKARKKKQWNFFKKFNLLKRLNSKDK